MAVVVGGAIGGKLQACTCLAVNFFQGNLTSCATDLGLLWNHGASQHISDDGEIRRQNSSPFGGRVHNHFMIEDLAARV